jgi:serine O-acetyltransferase
LGHNQRVIFLEDVRAILSTKPMLLRYDGLLSGWKFAVYVPVMLIFNPGVLAVGLFRLSSFLRSLPFPARWFALLFDRLNTLLTGVQLPAAATFGPGLVIMHPQAVVLSPNMTAGSNLTVVGPSVTVGWQDIDGDPDGQEVLIGDDVVIGAGAKVLGPLTVGDRVQIGPNAMLTEDAGDDTTVISAARTKVLSLSD